MTTFAKPGILMLIASRALGLLSFPKFVMSEIYFEIHAYGRCVLGLWGQPQGTVRCGRESDEGDWLMFASLHDGTENHRKVVAIVLMNIPSQSPPPL